jgi:hypothetical protein
MDDKKPKNISLEGAVINFEDGKVGRIEGIARKKCGGVGFRVGGKSVEELASEKGADFYSVLESVSYGSKHTLAGNVGGSTVIIFAYGKYIKGNID